MLLFRPWLLNSHSSCRPCPKLPSSRKASWSPLLYKSGLLRGSVLPLVMTHGFETLCQPVLANKETSCLHSSLSSMACHTQGGPDGFPVPSPCLGSGETEQSWQMPEQMLAASLMTDP